MAPQQILPWARVRVCVRVRVGAIFRGAIFQGAIFLVPLKSNYKHLQGVDVHSLNPGGIGTDFPELQIHFDFTSGEPHQPYVLKTKLGWVLLDGKSIASICHSI